MRGPHAPEVTLKSSLTRFLRCAVNAFGVYDSAVSVYTQSWTTVPRILGHFQPLLSYLPSPRQATSYLLSVPINLLILVILYKWNHTIGGPL